MEMEPPKPKSGKALEREKSCNRSRGKGKFGKRLKMFEEDVLEIRPSRPPIGMIDIVGEDMEAPARMRLKLKGSRVEKKFKEGCSRWV